MDGLERNPPFYSATITVKVAKPVGGSSSRPTGSSHAARATPHGLHTSAPVSHDSSLKDLTVSVLKGTQTQSSGGSFGLWAIELTDEEDATFNHYFVVSEFEYSEFAKEKGFLCDFRAFGEKIVQDLLKPVGASQTDATTDSSSSRPNEVSAFLTIKDASAVSTSEFTITETKPSQRVTLLTLVMQQADDVRLKRYLAGRVKMFRSMVEDGQEQIRSLADELRRVQSAGEAKQVEVNRLRLEAEKMRGSAEAQHAKELSEVREQAAIAARALEEKHAAALAETTTRYEKQLEELRGRLEAATATSSALTTEKAQLEATIREIRSTLSVTSSDATSGQAEVARLRTALAESESVRISQAKELTSAMTRIAVLEQSLTDKGELLERTNSLLSAAEEAKATLEESLQLYKSSCNKQQQKLESCVAEINRGNAIITKLQEDVKLAKSKSKAKSEALRTLEASLAEKSATMDTLQREISQLRADLDRERFGRETADANIATLKSKLVQAQEAITQNEQTMAFLNQRLTAYEMGAVKGGSPSKDTSMRFLSPGASTMPATPAPSAIPRYRPATGTTASASSASTVSVYSPPEVAAAPAKDQVAPASTPAPTTTTAHATPAAAPLTTPPKPASVSSFILSKQDNPYLQRLVQSSQMVAGGSPGLVL